MLRTVDNTGDDIGLNDPKVPARTPNAGKGRAPAFPQVESLAFTCASSTSAWSMVVFDPLSNSSTASPHCDFAE
jgi:hypothetical protein